MTNRSVESDFLLDESLTKARKPYTISKQREKWTEDEHNKFLEALQLHSRNWRRIEEHIGTKTTIQIRSHAQKFFSKVTRESSNESIQIPPPRPKRKPAHPYPRKLGNTKPGKQIPALEKMEKRSSKDMVLGEEENSSPTSVLSSELLGSTSPVISAGGSNEADIGSMFSNDEPKLSSLMESEKQNDDNDEEEEEICAESGSPSVKLFGKTVISTGSNYENATRNTFETVEMDIESTIQPENAQNNYNISQPFLYYNYAPHYVLWNPYGNMSYPLVKPEAVSPKVNSEEITNNLDNSQGLNSKISSTIGLGLRGFMPYKKRVVESEDGEIELSTRLCL